MQTILKGIGVTLKDRVEEAIALLQEHEAKALELSPDGYFLGFSGGKDSVVIKALADMAGVKHRAVYNQTTIDPPELVRFIKQHYPHVEWRRPKRNFFRAVIDSHGLPSRLNRWCCEELKESGGDGLIKVLGVRAAESVRRKKQWNPITQWRSGLGGFVVAPIVYWSTDEVWKFIKENKLPYCSLYDEGWNRLGCVGCPMAGKGRLAQFKRWPGFEKAWRRATRGYFNRRKGKLNRLGEPYYIERFASGDEFFDWWLSDNPTPKDDESQECLGLWDDVI